MVQTLLATFRARQAAWLPWLTPTMWQTGLLFGVDMVTNVADYAFHIYLGWALLPGDFATVQTMNSVLLIVVTAFGVMQPVVARYVAAGDQESRRQAIFQAYFWQSGGLGLLLALLYWLGRDRLAGWLNVPVAAAAALTPLLLLALLRPVVAGMLQGQQRFVSFGLTRTVYAVGRLALVLLLVGLWGGGAVAGIGVMSLGALLALLVGLALLGRAVWRRSAPLPGHLVAEGWRLSLGALLVYAGYMALLNVDLIWVNRLFAPELAGNYATAVVFRRISSVLPGAVLVIFYPRVVARVATGRRPDRLLAKAAAVIVGANLLLTAVYFTLGPALIRLMFGGGYPHAAPLLGWMGLAMVGYGATAIWLNLFLATRPAPFIGLLAGVVLLQVAGLAAGPETLLGVTAVFAVNGWLLALGGLLLYLAWLRPRLPNVAS